MGDLILLEDTRYVESPVTVEVGTRVLGNRDLRRQQPPKPPVRDRASHQLNVRDSWDVLNHDVGGLYQGISIQPDMEILSRHRYTSLAVRGRAGVAGSGRLRLNRDIGQQRVEIEWLAEDAIGRQVVGMKAKIRAG